MAAKVDQEMAVVRTKGSGLRGIELRASGMLCLLFAVYHLTKVPISLYPVGGESRKVDLTYIPSSV
jgi:hypothetical protein